MQLKIIGKWCNLLDKNACELAHRIFFRIYSVCLNLFDGKNFQVK